MSSSLKQTAIRSTQPQARNASRSNATPHPTHSQPRDQNTSSWPPLVFATFVPSRPGPGSRPRQPEVWYGCTPAFSSYESRSSYRYALAASRNGRTGGSGTGVLFVGSVRSNARRLSGTQRAGEGARRARLRGRGATAVVVLAGTRVGSREAVTPWTGTGAVTPEASAVVVARPRVGVLGSAESDLRLREDVPRGARGAEAGDAVSLSEVGGAPSECTCAGAGVGWAARQVRLWRVRLEATLKRRPQLSHGKAGGEREGREHGWSRGAEERAKSG